MPRGGSLAIVGRNGAGKSTLLRLLAGVARPSRGTIDIRGSVRSLLDLGAGLFDDMTGRENASLALGLDEMPAARAAQTARRAFEFAGVEGFLDEPLRTWSAGMRIRLAYALAVAVHPDILVADEVLAVGDEEFQRRCSRHVEGFLAGGGTLVLASHNLYHVEKLCPEAIWLDGGRLRMRGPSRQVTAAYRAWVEESESDVVPTLKAVGFGARLRIVGNGDDDDVARIREGDTLVVVVEETRRDAASALPATARLEIRLPRGACVASLAVGGRRLVVPDCPLLPGRYFLRLADGPGGGPLAADLVFDCVGSSRELGTMRLSHEWS